MYSPHCYSHPESVDDAYYYCYYGDNGGVHRNSGVLNLVYALFVDGGEFKGTTYTGIGLTKAFHIFMRGLAKHTPTATLAQNADYVTAVRFYNLFSTVSNVGDVRLAMNLPIITSYSKIC